MLELYKDYYYLVRALLNCGYSIFLCKLEGVKVNCVPFIVTPDSFNYTILSISHIRVLSYSYNTPPPPLLYPHETTL